MKQFCEKFKLEKWTTLNDSSIDYEQINRRILQIGKLISELSCPRIRKSIVTLSAVPLLIFSIIKNEILYKHSQFLNIL